MIDANRGVAQEYTVAFLWKQGGDPTHELDACFFQDTVFFLFCPFNLKRPEWFAYIYPHSGANTSEQVFPGVFCSIDGHGYDWRIANRR